MFQILLGKGLAGDTRDTAVPMESNQGLGNDVSPQPAVTNGELELDEKEKDFYDMLWHIGLDEDLEDMQFSIFEGVIGSTKLVS